MWRSSNIFLIAKDCSVLLIFLSLYSWNVMVWLLYSAIFNLFMFSISLTTTVCIGDQCCGFCSKYLIRTKARTLSRFNVKIIKKKSSKWYLLSDSFFEMCNLRDWCRKRDRELHCLSHIWTSEVVAYRFRGQNTVRIIHFLVVKFQEHRR